MKKLSAKRIIIFSVLAIFTFSAVSAFAWGGRGMSGKGMGQGYHKFSNKRYGQVAQNSVNGNAGEFRGRDFVQNGVQKELTGTLETEETEWFLMVDSTRYALHMGPAAYRESKGFSLTENSVATVSGFVQNTDIAVSTISSDDMSISLRDTNGRPAWAGSKFSNRHARN